MNRYILKGSCLSKYGQYCPIAQALELIGDRWTLLIIRDMLTGTQHFTDLERGLPRISRALLSKRLKQLQDAGIVEKRFIDSQRRSTEYHLTEAGWELQDVVNSLLLWGAKWSFADPSLDQLDPLLLLWWMRSRVNRDQLPDDRVVMQFNFNGAEVVTYWLILTRKDVTLCLTDPGFEINVYVTADLETFFKVWLGRMPYLDALESRKIRLDGIPRLTKAFPTWFAWSLAAPVVASFQQPHA